MSAHVHLRVKQLQSEITPWLALNPPPRVDCWSFDENFTFDVPKLGLIDNQSVFCENCKDQISAHIEDEGKWVNFTQMNLFNPHKDICDCCGQAIFFDPIWHWVTENILIGDNNSVRSDASPDHVWVLHHILERVVALEPKNSPLLEKVLFPLKSAFQIAKRTHP
jgi:hypothetical protein